MKLLATLIRRGLLSTAILLSIVSATRATPKSSTFTVPSGSSMTFDGFTSR